MLGERKKGQKKKKKGIVDGNDLSENGKRNRKKRVSVRPVMRAVDTEWRKRGRAA